MSFTVWGNRGGEQPGMIYGVFGTWDEAVIFRDELAKRVRNLDLSISHSSGEATGARIEGKKILEIE